MTIEEKNKLFGFTEDYPNDEKATESYRLPLHIIEGVKSKAKQERRTKSAVAEKALTEYLKL
jgi:hypothetical protein